HFPDIDDAALVDPPEDLARAKPRDAARLEEGLERRTIDLGEVGSAGHVIMCILACNPFSLNRLRWLAQGLYTNSLPCRTHQSSATCSITDSASSPSG